VAEQFAPVSSHRIISITDRERDTVPEMPAVKGVNVAPIPEAPELDELDEAFFRAAEKKAESFPPVAEDVEEQPIVVPLSPALVARRNKLRKFVGVVVALGALFMVGGLGKSLLSSPAEAAEHAVTEPEAATPAAAVAPAPLEPVAANPAQADIAIPAPVEAPPAVTAEVTAKVAAEEAEPSAKVEDPRAEALKLLNRGKLQEAIPMARAAIDKEPDHALGYLYLGAALQDTGKYKDAIAVYSDCVRTAKKGPLWECRAMGGRP
jgi:TolA-binding protein